MHWPAEPAGTFNSSPELSGALPLRSGHFGPLNFQLLFPLKTLLGSVWVLPPCAVVWKLGPGHEHG